MCHTLAGAWNLKPNRIQSESSESNNLEISIQSESGHGKGRGKKSVKAKRRELLAHLGAIGEACTEEVLFDLVLEAEKEFFS